MTLILIPQPEPEVVEVVITSPPIEQTVEVVKVVTATPDPIALVAMDQPAPLSRQVIEQGSECESDLSEGEIRFSTNRDPAPWQQCHYRIRPNRGIVAATDSNVSPLGYLQADISYSVPENPVLTGSASAYLEMVTFVDTIGLQIHCGVTDRWNEDQDFQERSAFISAALVGDPDRLKCPAKIEGQDNHDTDPSDARCELYWDTFGEPLDSDSFYMFKLEALQESHGVFVCSIEGEDYPDYSVNMQEIGWGGVDLLQLQFQRFVEVDVVDYRTTNFFVTDVRETP